MNENNPIGWSKDFFLDWNNFKADHNPTIFEDAHSEIKFRFTWTVTSDTLDNKIIFSIQNIELFVEFHPLLSSFRTLEKNDIILKHEQGHFDLAELFKNEHLPKLQNKFYNKPFPTRGQNDDQRKQFAKEDSGKMIVVEIEKLEEQLQTKRQKYDDETSLGHNQEKQTEYDVLFTNLRK
ncbi:MAG: hypothetical protein MAG458_01401 [Nitrosopumilus sp.]|nr:hypothetical protein [Nitrosopumilus sp.]